VRVLWVALAAMGVAGLAVAQGTSCSGVSPWLIPDLSGRPSLSLNVTPEGLAAPGTLSVVARVQGYVVSATLSVRGALRWEDYGPVVLRSWGGSPTAAVHEARFGPLDPSANGMYTFSLTATVCYRLNGVVREETLTQETHTPVYIPWSTTDLPRLLWKEAETTNYIRGFLNDVAGGEPMFIEGLVTGLAEGVRALLRDYLVRGYLNQGNYPPSCWWLCYSVAPVQVRLYAVQGVEGLFQQGWASLGFFGGMRDSRSYELGTKGVAGVLVVRGYRHDYILLSRRGDFSDETQVIEMPKGGAEVFRKALALSALQSQAREVRP